MLQAEADGGGFDRELLTEAVRAAAPALMKLQVVLEILNARLLDIRDWWDTGALTQRGFSAAEVGRLVRFALFHQPISQRNKTSF